MNYEKELREKKLAHPMVILPSFSFNKGERQPGHSNYNGLIKLPYGCKFTFKVEEGDAVEITWAHSIYYTDVVEFELVNY